MQTVDRAPRTRSGGMRDAGGRGRTAAHPALPGRAGAAPGPRGRPGRRSADGEGRHKRPRAAPRQPPAAASAGKLGKVRARGPPARPQPRPRAEPPLSLPSAFCWVVSLFVFFFLIISLHLGSGRDSRKPNNADVTFIPVRNGTGTDLSGAAEPERRFLPPARCPRAARPGPLRRGSAPRPPAARRRPQKMNGGTPAKRGVRRRLTRVT